MKIPLPRSVLNLTGLDSIKFLNGICTQTIPTPSDGGRYAAFLTPQGRMLYDTFIYPYDNNSYYLEVDNRVSDSVLALCKKYQLRSKVRLHKMKITWSSKFRVMIMGRCTSRIMEAWKVCRISKSEQWQGYIRVARAVLCGRNP